MKAIFFTTLALCSGCVFASESKAPSGAGKYFSKPEASLRSSAPPAPAPYASKVINKFKDYTISLPSIKNGTHNASGGASSQVSASATAKR